MWECPEPNWWAEIMVRVGRNEALRFKKKFKFKMYWTWKDHHKLHQNILSSNHLPFRIAHTTHSLETLHEIIVSFFLFLFFLCRFFISFSFFFFLELIGLNNKKFANNHVVIGMLYHSTHCPHDREKGGNYRFITHLQLIVVSLKRGFLMQFSSIWNHWQTFLSRYLFQ